MSSVYIVCAVDVASDDCVVEAHAGFESAAKSAISLAEKKLGLRGNFAGGVITRNPQPIHDFGNLEWIFMNYASILVSVSYKEIIVNRHYKSPVVNSKIDLSNLDINEINIDNMSSETGILPPIKVDANIDNLPGGFDFNNKALTIKDIKDNPFRVKSAVHDLNANQQRALILARFRKNKNNDYFGDTGIAALENKSPLGDLIIRQSCIILDAYVDALKVNALSDEAESSSSSEDEYEC